MRSPVGWSNNVRPEPIRATPVALDQCNVEIDGEHVVVTALGIERLRLPRADAVRLAKLLEARA